MIIYLRNCFDYY